MSFQPTYTEARRYESDFSHTIYLAQKRWDHGWDLTQGVGAQIWVSDERFAEWERAFERIGTRIA